MTTNKPMPDDVLRKISSFRPASMSSSEWADWEDSIVACARAMHPETPGSAKRWMTLLVAFVRSLIELGLEAPIQPLLTVDYIEWHVSQVGSKRSAATRRSELTRVGRVVNPNEPWSIKKQQFTRTSRDSPYSYEELLSLRRAAPHARTEARRRLFQTVLALGLCVGLTGRNIRDVTPKRIVDSDGVTAIRGSGSRPDIVLPYWAGTWMRYWREQTEHGKAVVGSASTYDCKLSELRGDDGKTRVIVARLRTTFVVHVISQGLPLHEVMALTGFTSTSSLDPYYRIMEHPQIAEPALLPPILDGGR